MDFLLPKLWLLGDLESAHILTDAGFIRPSFVVKQTVQSASGSEGERFADWTVREFVDTGLRRCKADCRVCFSLGGEEISQTGQSAIQGSL